MLCWQGSAVCYIRVGLYFPTKTFDYCLQRVPFFPRPESGIYNLSDISWFSPSLYIRTMKAMLNFPYSNPALQSTCIVWHLDIFNSGVDMLNSFSWCWRAKDFLFVHNCFSMAFLGCLLMLWSPVLLKTVLSDTLFGLRLIKDLILPHDSCWVTNSV